MDARQEQMEERRTARLERLAWPKGRARLKELVANTRDELLALEALLDRDAPETNKHLVRGAIMDVEGAQWRVEEAVDKIREATRG